MKKINKKILSLHIRSLAGIMTLVLTLAFVIGLASSAQAKTASAKTSIVSGTVSSAPMKLSADRLAKGNKEIDVRVDSLSKLNDRVGEMKRLTDAQKTSIQAEIQSLVDNFKSLKIKINDEATTGTTSLKTDIQSITQHYRVYALVMPQINILAALDRIGNVTDALVILGNKIESRISEAQKAGKDVTILQKTLADFKAKVADENTQAQNALNLITPLAPDNGDKTVAASNKKALTEARADVKKAHQDIVDARKDAKILVKALSDMNASSGTTASTTTTH